MNACGVAHFTACAVSGSPPVPNAWFGPPFSASEALGVAQRSATQYSMSFRSLPSERSIVVPPPLWSRVVGVSHPEDEDPLALVARANLCRREQSCLNRETQLA